MARTVKRYALVGALSLGSLASLAGAQEFDWRRFEGTNIRF